MNDKRKRTIEAKDLSQARRYLQQLPPGSDEALDHGCTCPVLDNAHGKGYMGIKGQYVMNQGCPMHGKAGWVADVSAE